jgi:hypothetical protein
LQGRSTYKIAEIVTGGGLVGAGSELRVVTAGDLFFLRPDEHISWHLHEKSILHYLDIDPIYFNGQPHLVKLFREHPSFRPGSGVARPTFQQAMTIGMVFKMIRNEAASRQDDRKQAILLHVQMLLLLSARAGKARQKTA